MSKKTKRLLLLNLPYALFALLGTKLGQAWRLAPGFGFSEKLMHLMEYSDLYVRRIRQLCKERGIAINKLATMSGINQSTIDNIVRGLTKNPRVMTLHKIAIAFNMTVAEFLDFKELNDFCMDVIIISGFGKTLPEIIATVKKKQ